MKMKNKNFKENNLPDFPLETVNLLQIFLEFSMEDSLIFIPVFLFDVSLVYVVRQ